MPRLALLACLCAVLAGCLPGDPPPDPDGDGDQRPAASAQSASFASPEEAKKAAPEGLALATFGGGCFWCMEPPFEGRPGVLKVISGYSGGPEKNPTYKQVSAGKTGHTEVVQITFDPSKISYAELVEIFWKSMDPSDLAGQFADRGKQYRPEIFAHDSEQARIARASKAKLAASGKFNRVIVPITPFEAFWPAEDYHQDYYKKNPDHYKRYRRGSGREGFLLRVWGEDAAGAASRK